MATVTEPQIETTEPDWDQILQEPTLEDRLWWAEHCDHSDWPADGVLSPEEQAREALTMSEIEYRMSLVEDWPW